MHNRQNALNKWLVEELCFSDYFLKPLTGDASFRSYYRLAYGNETRIIMDAPPAQEPLKPFIDIAHFLRTYGVPTPQVFAVNEPDGFALLQDFGDNLLLTQLSTETSTPLYQQAMAILVQLQQAKTAPYPFPHFDEAFILKELSLFQEWFLQAYLKIPLTAEEEQVITNALSWLAAKVSRQPTTLIHRDYHSRNVMLLATGELGVIDFQDAMLGPFTYDLVSLLKDCYIQWPRDKILSWLKYFYSKSRLAQQISFAEFSEDFELCGLQRHLKVLGVFCRLYLRDGKANYLNSLPLTLNYVLQSLETIPELQNFYHLVQKRVRLC